MLKIIRQIGEIKEGLCAGTQVFVPFCLESVASPQQRDSGVAMGLPTISCRGGQGRGGHAAPGPLEVSEKNPQR